MRHPGIGAALLALACATAPAAAQTRDTSTARIVLSNSHAGNAWRLAMLESWREAARDARARRLVGEAPALTADENTVEAQARQIAGLVAEGVAAIVVNAASERGLDQAVTAACEAGVVVVSFDGIVAAPCAWRLSIDYAALGREQVERIAARLTGPVRILEVRGIAGTPVDEAIARGVREGVAASRGRLAIVASVHGDWTQSVAQREVARVLSTVGPIDAVVTQGGDGRGAAAAFLEAGRPMPLVVLGNRRAELEWWRERRAADGYDTFSLGVAPSVAQIAFWIAQRILAGADVPRELVLPLLVVEGEDLDAALARTPPGGLTTTTYDAAWTDAFIAAARAGQPVPASPRP